MTVRCKFYVSEKAETGPGLFKVTMNPVMEGSPENKEFFKWSPGGKFEIATINDKAAGRLLVGEEYYIDITEAPKAGAPAPDPQI